MNFIVPDLVRYALILWSIISAILSLVGNTIVLVASRKYKALTLDKYSLRLVDNLAAADIGYTAAGIIPTIGAIAAADWVYGGSLCIADRFLTNVFYNMTPLIVALLCVSKLSCIMSPLTALSRDTRHVDMAVCLVWSLTIASCLVSTAVYRNDIYFDNLSFQCWVDYTHREYFGSFLIGYMVLVAAVIVTSTVWLLVLARRTTGGVRRKGATAIIAVSAFYSIAIVPTALLMALELTSWYASWTDDAKAISKIVTTFSFYLTNFCNPIVYYFSIRSFKEFVDKKIFIRVSEEPASLGNATVSATANTNEPLLGNGEDDIS